MPAVVAGTFDDGGSLGRLLYALRAADVLEPSRPSCNVCRAEDSCERATHGPGSDCHAGWNFRTIAAGVLDFATKETTSPAQAAELLRALLTAQRKRKVRPAGDLAASGRGCLKPVMPRSRLQRR